MLLTLFAAALSISALPGIEALCDPPPQEPATPKRSSCKIIPVLDALGCTVAYNEVCKGEVPQSPGCPPIAFPSARKGCVWRGISEETTGCVKGFTCEPDCPKVPFPTLGGSCVFFFPVFNTRGCITAYECDIEGATVDKDKKDPVLEPALGCKSEPKKPRDTSTCIFRPIINNKGCIKRYFCSTKTVATTESRKTKKQTKKTTLRTETTTIQSPTSAVTEEPIDADPFCCWWALEDQCDVNPLWMRPNCQRSCGTIDCTVETAKDCKVKVNADDCPIPHPKNEKKKKIVEIEENEDGNPEEQDIDENIEESEERKDEKERASNQSVRKCTDEHAHCVYWATIGECTKNPFYMYTKCRKACDFNCSS